MQMGGAGQKQEVHAEATAGALDAGMCRDQETAEGLAPHSSP